MNELIFIVEESLDGGYEARSVGASVFTQGDDISDLKKQINDAVNCHFEEDKLPKIIQLHYTKDEVFAL
jgi:hypothetical protein